jgi:hypothetical protein
VKKFTVILFLLIIAATALSQSKVCGKVLSKNDRRPIQGAMIIKKGTNEGTATDLTGTFVLQLKDSNTILVISAIGFEETEIIVNGKDSLQIFLKEFCARDWFDNQQIGFSLVSGVIHDPYGAQLDFSFPAFYKQTTLKVAYSYQTNFNENNFSNGEISFSHIAPSCYFVADVRANYRNLSYDNKINSSSYSIQTDLNFRRIKYIVGISKINFANTEKQKTVSAFGPLVGMGTWIAGRSAIFVGAQVSVYKELIEYRINIEKRFKKFNSFMRFYKIDDFNEVSIGIGKTYTYRIKKR